MRRSPSRPRSDSVTAHPTQSRLLPVWQDRWSHPLDRQSRSRVQEITEGRGPQVPPQYEAQS